MPTGASSDVIPVRKATKQRLASIKGTSSYDELIATLLEVTPPEELQRILEARQRATARAMRFRQQAEERIRRGRERSPEKQLLIASLARQRWQRWKAEGRVRELGPRLVAWTPKPKGARRRMDIAWQRGRGFPPGEGESDG